MGYPTPLPLCNNMHAGINQISHWATLPYGTQLPNSQHEENKTLIWLYVHCAWQHYIHSAAFVISMWKITHKVKLTLMVVLMQLHPSLTIAQNGSCSPFLLSLHPWTTTTAESLWGGCTEVDIDFCRSCEMNSWKREREGGWISRPLWYLRLAFDTLLWTNTSEERRNDNRSSLPADYHIFSDALSNSIIMRTTMKCTVVMEAYHSTPRPLCAWCMHPWSMHKNLISMKSD